MFVIFASAAVTKQEQSISEEYVTEHIWRNKPPQKKVKITLKKNIWAAPIILQMETAQIRKKVSTRHITTICQKLVIAIPQIYKASSFQHSPGGLMKDVVWEWPLKSIQSQEAEAWCPLGAQPLPSPTADNNYSTDTPSGTTENRVKAGFLAFFKGLPSSPKIFYFSVRVLQIEHFLSKYFM